LPHFKFCFKERWQTKIAFVHAAGAISLHGARQRFENVEFIFEVRGDHSPQHKHGIASELQDQMQMRMMQN
jgi:hypothetical protein